MKFWHFLRPVETHKRKAALVGMAVASAAGIAFAQGYDGMFQTANTWWNCYDGGNASVQTADYCQQDNGGADYYIENSLANFSYAATVNIALAVGEFDATDMSFGGTGSPSYSGSGETDVIIQRRADVPVGADGVAWCDDAISSTRCDQHYIGFRNYDVSQALACHELGHTVGLTHGMEASPAQANNSAVLGCMQTPVPTGTALGANNVTLINATY